MSIDLNAVREFARRYNHDVGHAEQVASLCAKIFDDLAPLHRLGERERDLLVAAAIAHDIGWCEGRQKHHKRAYSLIVADPPEGMTQSEAAIVANIARYHRRALPGLAHEGYASLSRVDRDTVRKLAAIIRVADGLDISHRSLVKPAGCGVSSSEVAIDVECPECVDEIQAATKKSDLFREVFGREIVFRESGSPTRL